MVFLVASSIMFQQNGGFSRYSAYMRGKKQRNRIKKILITVAGFFALIGLVSLLGFSTLQMNGEAMAPTFHDGDRLISLALPYGLRLGGSHKRYFAAGNPERGDVVLARPAYNSSPSVWVLALDRFISILSFQKLTIERLLGDHRGDSLLVRRVVGIPGDTLYLDGGKVFCKPRGNDAFQGEEQLSVREYSPSLPPDIPGWESQYPGTSDFPEIVLGENEYFLICDNRRVMDDSRLWGPVPARAVLGKIVFSYWPLPVFD